METSFASGAFEQAEAACKHGARTQISNVPSEVPSAVDPKEALPKDVLPPGSPLKVKDFSGYHSRWHHRALGGRCRYHLWIP